MRRHKLTFLLVMMVLISSGSTLASPTGSITGFVKDPSGAVVSNVQLTLLRKDTSTKLIGTTDANGYYQFLQLPPAIYSLAAEASGFKKVNFGSVVVQVDQVTHLDIKLDIGNVSEVIEVAATTTPLLESDKSTMSSVIDSRVVANMPLNARQFLDLALLTPGVLPTATGTQGGGFSVAGARSQSNIFLVDGVSNQDTQINSPLNNFRITDAVQEYAVQTSVALPEFGRGTGGQVNIVTKSGTNRFHGTAFEYLRNTVFDSADFFTNKSGGKKNPLNRNQFGATFSGPIVRDRLFFFLSYEGFRQVAPTVSSTRVPNAAERASVTDTISKGLLQFWPTANTFNPGSANNYISNVRAVNNDNTGLLRLDYNLSENDRLSGRWIEFRGQTLTPGPTPLNGGNANSPLSRSVVLTHTHTFSRNFINELRLGYSRNETKILVQDNGFNAATVFLDGNGNPLPGVVDATLDPENSGLPTINIANGFASLGSTDNLPQGRITSTYEIFDNMTLSAPFGWARNSWRWGFHIRREDARRYLNGSSRGTFNFASFADFAQGLVNTSAIRTGQTVAYFRRYPFDFYWQDQFKVKENLTLNYGIRYEYPSAIYEIRNHGTNFIPDVGPVVLGSNQILDIDPTKRGAGAIFFREAPFKLSSSGVTSDKNNFAPIMGFAYSPRFSEKLFGKDSTVIRGGFRIGYDEVFNNIPANLSLTAPYNLITNQSANGTQPGKFPWAIGLTQNVPLVSNFGSQRPGNPTVGVLSFNSIDPHIRSTYLYQYSLGIQRKLRNSFSVEVDYQGSAGHKLGMFVNINQPAVIVSDPSRRGPQAPNEQLYPYPKYGAITMGMNLGNSNYNGVIFTGKYQGRGIYIQSSYTLGKSMDYQSAFFGSLFERQGAADGRNLQLERGPSSFDIRHRMSIYYVMDLPIGPGRRLFGWNNGLNRQIFGGWQISGITTLQSGSPFTVITNTVTDFSGFNLLNDRPDLTRSGPLTKNYSDPDKAFDTTYFGATPAGRAGNSGRNQYYGPGLQNFDFALAKIFPVSEGFRLQLRGDFFNIFNHTNFSNPVNNMSNANFGKITQTVGSATATAVGTTGGPLGGPRLIQLSLRLQF
jgi:carboxypeptidase family protein